MACPDDFGSIDARVDRKVFARCTDENLCATLLLGSNVHPKYVQELLGHASIALTLDTYSHVLKGMDGGIGGAMDEALG